MPNASEVREQATALHALVERCAPGTPRKVRKEVASYYELERVFWEAHPRYAFYDFFLAAPERTLDVGYARTLAASLRLSTPLPDRLAVVGPPAYPTGRVSYQLAYRTGRGADDGPIEAIWSDAERLTYPSYLQYLTHCALKWMSGHAVVRCTIVKLEIVPPRLAFPALSQRVFDGGDGVLGLPVSGELDRDEPASHGRYRIVAPSREALTRWLETHPWKRDWEPTIPEFLRGKIAPSALGIVTAHKNATANEQTAAKNNRATAEQTAAKNKRATAEQTAAKNKRATAEQTTANEQTVAKKRTTANEQTVAKKRATANARTAAKKQRATANARAAAKKRTTANARTAAKKTSPAKPRRPSSARP